MLHVLTAFRDASQSALWGAVAQDVNLFAGRTASLRLLLQERRENVKVVKKRKGS
jgi:hypothetical protein